MSSKPIPMATVKLILDLCHCTENPHLPRTSISVSQVNMPFKFKRHNVPKYDDNYVASQMMTFVQLLPFMIGDKVPLDDEHWNSFLLLWDICSMVCAYEVTEDFSVHLAWVVEI